MVYRIQVFFGDQLIADFSSARPLDDTRAEAVYLVDTLSGDYALIVDEFDAVIDRMKRSLK